MYVNNYFLKRFSNSSREDEAIDFKINHPSKLNDTSKEAILI